MSIGKAAPTITTRATTTMMIRRTTKTTALTTTTWNIPGMKVGAIRKMTTLDRSSMTSTITAAWAIQTVRLRWRIRRVCRPLAVVSGHLILIDMRSSSSAVEPVLLMPKTVFLLFTLLCLTMLRSDSTWSYLSHADQCQNDWIQTFLHHGTRLSDQFCQALLSLRCSCPNSRVPKIRLTRIASVVNEICMERKSIVHFPIIHIHGPNDPVMVWTNN